MSQTSNRLSRQEQLQSARQLDLCSLIGLSIASPNQRRIAQETLHTAWQRFIAQTLVDVEALLLVMDATDTVISGAGAVHFLRDVWATDHQQFEFYCSKDHFAEFFAELTSLLRAKHFPIVTETGPPFLGTAILECVVIHSAGLRFHVYRSTTSTPLSIIASSPSTADLVFLATGGLSVAYPWLLQDKIAMPLGGAPVQTVKDAYGAHGFCVIETLKEQTPSTPRCVPRGCCPRDARHFGDNFCLSFGYFANIPNPPPFNTGSIFARYFDDIRLSYTMTWTSGGQPCGGTYCTTVIPRVVIPIETRTLGCSLTETYERNIFRPLSP